MISDSVSNAIEIRTQKGKTLLHLQEGGYAISNGLLSISVSAELSDEDRENDDIWPEYGAIAIESASLTKQLEEGDVFECHGGMDNNDDDVTPRAHGYFGFHVEDIKLRWTVISVLHDVCRFQLEAIHDDPDYYDEREKPSPTTGDFLLKKCEVEELWMPC